MKIIWLGHGSFRIETGDKVLLIDPWLTGNPVLPEAIEQDIESRKTKVRHESQYTLADNVAAQLLQADGRRVVVLGKPEHVEVRGIVEDLVDPIVVRTAADVATWPEERLGVVCQTTTPSDRTGTPPRPRSRTHRPRVCAAGGSQAW